MYQLSIRLKKSLPAYSFLAPAFVFIIIFTLVPLVLAVIYSFEDWDFGKTSAFIGLSNYQYLLTNPLFGLALRNTIIYTIGVVTGVTIISLALAILVNGGLIFQPLFRTVYFLPAVSSIAIVAVIFKVLYNPTYGLLNYLLSLVGIPMQMWLVSTKTALPAIMIMDVWKSVGYYMIIFLAGLQGIPQSLYDAAAVDGAGRWKSFFYITVPLLSPTILFVVVVSTIGCFQVFDSVFIMTGGGPVNRTMVLGQLIYTYAFSYFHLGKASAMAFVLAIIIFAVSYIQRRLLNKEVEY
jgi:multiple sugar transport system permease protein